MLYLLHCEFERCIESYSGYIALIFRDRPCTSRMIKGRCGM